mmetsp:Transcript_1784/g.3828  ORF Transcript_1784/g.3828 Transcript_1784/m.3828 type:complete len:349 (-) Transcript_1784:226-1272(-)|eukprot:CAMPEP_0172325356 /NCGR_PEP_ID=MMETSP1058-20130122/53801_1 /TAXON_ID=83371 /ORGANISM="Detonula confervacea, Strain CCMP 353" /LENGTH=348 /DNA_ID=CAMNT_0013041879 /DNA_START=504 /DNA_END=1550 /DNA_ORIENTATION=-
MKSTLIISIATLATTFDLVAADNGRQSLRRAKAESKASKGHKSGKGSKTSTPPPVEPTSTKCDNGSLYLCNDYVAVDEKYKYGYGIEHMDGAEVMSGIPGLHRSIASKFELVPHNITNDAFNDTLKAVGMHPALGSSTFGDQGYDNPGHGGINNYDIFYLNSTMTFTNFGNYTVNATGDPCNPKVDTDSECQMVVDESGFDAKHAPWWSFPDDAKGLSLIEAKDQVSQLCWTKGYLQGLLCEFEEGTHVMVGMGSWRGTSGTSDPNSPGNNNASPECEDGFANPQKVVSPNVYQYIIPRGNDSDEHSPVEEKEGSCYVCTANTADAAATFDNYKSSNNCWRVDDYTLI